MKTISILLFSVVILTYAKANKKFTINQPIVDTDDRPNFAARMPEERRKLPLFPKIIKKFVIDSEPIAKTKFTELNVIMPAKRPLPKCRMLPQESNAGNSIISEPVTRPSLMKFQKFTLQPAVVQPVRKIKTYSNLNNRLSALNSDRIVDKPDSIEVQNDSNDNESFENDKHKSSDYVDGSQSDENAAVESMGEMTNPASNKNYQHDDIEAENNSKSLEHYKDDKEAENGDIIGSSAENVKVEGEHNISEEYSVESIENGHVTEAREINETVVSADDEFSTDEPDVLEEKSDESRVLTPEFF